MVLGVDDGVVAMFRPLAEHTMPPMYSCNLNKP